LLLVVFDGGGGGMLGGFLIFCCSLLMLIHKPTIRERNIFTDDSSFTHESLESIVLFSLGTRNCH
jgi:hypothetical protein